ncbi:FlhC family transcriptional regulator [Thorsellia anophelis]|uniref:Transcriptional activator (FlhC) n=1 Tax=Thorsellia anophelis DSM 18579 TaxID=1123402 RepID=A0A1I0D270_9GAMM|nr:FlhC family transcriptional regulator [Thorsellia anophelis]SET25705.1 transcriptional activator (FlhC) [Thorsellia anophelis DSM 18579]
MKNKKTKTPYKKDLSYNPDKLAKSKISRINIQYEAIKFLKAGIKITIIASSLDISLTHLRDFFRGIFSESPKGGQMPTIESLLSTQSRQIEAAIFLEIYIKFAQSDYKSIDLNNLIKSYNCYEEIRTVLNLDKTPKWKKFDINEAWVIAKGLISRRIIFRRCSSGCAYIEASEQSTKLECPHCKLTNTTKKKLTK